MKLGRLNHVGVATPSIADSIAYTHHAISATLAACTAKHYNDLVMCRS